jgi:site-specific recombinase XerD
MVASSKVGKDGKASLLLSIIVNKKRVSIQLQKKLKPSEFNNKTQLSTIKDVNEYISIVKSRIMGIQTNLFAQGVQLSAQKIKDAYNGVQSERKWGLIELYKQHNSDLKKMIGITIGKNTYDKHEFLLNYLRKYMKNIDRPIEDLNTSFVNGFYAYLRHDIKQQHNTAIGYMKKLRTIFNMALNDNLISKSPFAGIKYSLEPVTPTFLTEDEISIIWNKEIDIKRLEQVRDIFVFCCMTGLAYIDCYNLTKEQILEDDQGIFYIKRKRQKTKVMATIPLNDVALTILEKYNFKLPILTNQKFNSYLKEIQDICSLKKNITCHVARHSAAVLLLNHGVSLNTVSKVLGHSNITMTQHYAKLLDKTIINEIKGIKLLGSK